MSTIKAMLVLSRQSWAGEIDLRWISLILSPDGPVFLGIFDQGPGVQESGHLQPGHVILALYNLVLTMYKRRPGFFLVDCGISLGDRGTIGRIYMSPIMPTIVQSSRSHGNLTETKATVQAGSFVSSKVSLTDDSDIIVDPEDTNFRIPWTVYGTSIPVQEIFSAAMDGIATTA